jgi:hypothetical protein
MSASSTVAAMRMVVSSFVIFNNSRTRGPTPAAINFMPLHWQLISCPTTIPKPGESIYGTSVKSRIFTTGGSSPGIDWKSKHISQADGRQRSVHVARREGSAETKITVPEALPLLGSILNGVPFQSLAWGVVIEQSSPKPGGTTGNCTRHSI